MDWIEFYAVSAIFQPCYGGKGVAGGHIVKCIVSLGVFFFTLRQGSGRLGYGDDVPGEVHLSCGFLDPLGGDSCAKVWPCG